MPLDVPLGYQARSQFAPLHLRTQRWACVVSHVRAGKTVACIMDLVDAALRCKLPEPRFAYVSPFYAQSKDVAWLYLKRFTAPIPGAEANESELRVDFPNGGRVRLYGADNYDRMRGIYLDGVVLDEFADFHPAAWPEVIRGRLSDRRGWATFIGTPKGRNAFFDIWDNALRSDDWFTLCLRASETGILSQEELDDARKMMTPEAYSQEYECSFDAAIMGAYYGREIADAERAGQICDLPVDPILPVNTAWDLGKGDSTEIWFWQVSPNGVRVIDYYENQGHDLDHYAAEIKSRSQAGNYKRGTHYLPHDARAQILGMKRTRLEQLMELLRGDKLTIVPMHTVEDGINAGRMTIKQAWFDADKCKFGLEALRQYRTDYDEKNKVFKKTPLHNWASHCADAWRYLSMGWREISSSPLPKRDTSNVTFTAQPDGGIKSNLTFAEIIKARERKARRR